eukprot:scaffold67110_cov48-Cyclotella_meneghiniana.AAC.1
MRDKEGKRPLWSRKKDSADLTQYGSNNNIILYSPAINPTTDEAILAWTRGVGVTGDEVRKL